MKSESDILASQFNARHQGVLADLACLSVLSAATFERLSPVVQRLLDVQRRAIEALAAEYGYEPEDVAAAIVELEQVLHTDETLRACDDDLEPAGASAAHTADLLARVKG